MEQSKKREQRVADLEARLRDLGNEVVPAKAEIRADNESYRDLTPSFLPDQAESLGVRLHFKWRGPEHLRVKSAAHQVGCEGELP